MRRYEQNLAYMSIQYSMIPRRMAMLSCNNYLLITVIMYLCVQSTIYSPACAQNKEIQSISNDFVIGGWVGPHQTEDQYLLYKEAAFNHVIEYLWEGDDYEKSLLLFKKINGLKLFLNLDQRFLRTTIMDTVKKKNDISIFIKNTERNDNVAGYFLFDEPDSSNREIIQRYGSIVKEMTGKEVWINFMVEKQFESVHAILGKYKPSIVSMDMYPFHEKSNGINHYYKLIDAFRQLAIQYNVSFWGFVQSAGWLDIHNNYRKPTPAEIRLQAYTNIAYSAKGLWYYTYVEPRHSKNIFAAILDKNDKPTETYDAVKSINIRVMSIAPWLIKLQPVEVFHCDAIKGALNAFAPNRYLTSIEPQSALIGHFIKDEKHFMFIVNKDTVQSTNFVLSISSDIKSITLIDNGLEQMVSNKNGKYTLSLLPGEGKLLGFNLGVN